MERVGEPKAFRSMMKSEESTSHPTGRTVKAAQRALPRELKNR
jgi:hypothetical protein